MRQNLNPYYVVSVLSIISIVHGALVTSPKDEVVLLGSKVRMECSTNLTYSMNWWYAPDFSTQSIKFYFGRKVIKSMSSNYQVDTIVSGQYALVMESVSKEMSGIYTCYDDESYLRIGVSAELVVLESEPQCSSTMVNDGLTAEIRCTVKFFGSSIPEINWIQDGEDVSGLQNKTLHDSPDVKMVVSTILVDKDEKKVFTKVTSKMWLKTALCRQFEDRCVFFTRSFPVEFESSDNTSNRPMNESFADHLNSENKKAAPVPTSIIIPTIVAFVLLVIATALAVFFFFKYRQEQKHNNTIKNPTDIKIPEADSLVTVKVVAASDGSSQDDNTSDASDNSLI